MRASGVTDAIVTSSLLETVSADHFQFINNSNETWTLHFKPESVSGTDTSGHVSNTLFYVFFLFFIFKIWTWWRNFFKQKRAQAFKFRKVLEDGLP